MTDPDLTTEERRALGGRRREWFEVAHWAVLVAWSVLLLILAESFFLYREWTIWTR